MFPTFRFHLSLLLLGCSLCGCGSTKTRSATEQLLVSDAVDRSIAGIDFHDLAGCSVYLDTQYVKSVKSLGFVNADYIISSLRQQMLAANCYLEEDRDKAEYIAEVRVGALGTDAHNVTYGIPASNSLNTAAALVPNSPPIPMIPEISLAKREDEVAAAKIAVFAYHRETRQAVWQSGIAQARSSSKDTWVLGVGPFQSGEIHNRTQFAGEEIPKLDLPLISSHEDDDSFERLRQYNRERTFVPLLNRKELPEMAPLQVIPAGHREETKVSEDPAAKSAATPSPAPVPAAE